MVTPKNPSQTSILKGAYKLNCHWLRQVGLIGVALLAMSGQASAEFRVGLVLDKGGKDDKSFNTSAYEGAMKAKDELSVFVKYVEATDDNAFESLIRSFVRKEFDLVIAVGVSQAEALKKVSALAPKTRFAIVDAEVQAPNVRSLLFEEHEGSYVVGAIAAMTSKTGKIGFLGGMDIPLIRRFEMGYEAGAKKINPKIKVMTGYVGVTGDAWNNPPKAKEIALSQYGSGADVIFSAAGASGAGLFDAAEETKKLAIGVDSNQNWIKPGHILTSMLKRVDVAVFTAIQAAQSGATGMDWTGTERFGFANHGIDYALDKYNAKLITPAIKNKADEIKAEIISGKIKVPDYYKKNAR